VPLLVAHNIAMLQAQEYLLVTPLALGCRLVVLPLLGGTHEVGHLHMESHYLLALRSLLSPECVVRFFCGACVLALCDIVTLLTCWVNFSLTVVRPSATAYPPA